ncbi:Leucine-rich repeat-containing protein 15 [Halotydeus destructor]|nr:Leucine-rich repeat-containing protein 15 [Halotydeus destructor]
MSTSHRITNSVQLNSSRSTRVYRMQSQSTLGHVTSCVNSLLRSVLIVLIVHQLLSTKSLLTEARCPTKCRCDRDLNVNCSGAVLDLVPITLNPRLEELDLSSNVIKNLGASNALAVYPHLRKLKLSRNEITSLSDNAFVSQKRLEILDLDENSISSLTVNSFNGLNLVEQLRLSQNKIDNITKSIFTKLRNLKELNLRRNAISELSSVAFVGLTGLEHLNLGHNRLRTLPPLSPSVLPLLRTLDLNHNNFTHIVKSTSPFAQRTVQSSTLTSVVDSAEGSSSNYDSNESFLWLNLQDVSLNGCSIELIDESAFEGLPFLFHLRLHDNNLQEIPSHIFKDLSKLRQLKIGANLFKSIEANSFYNLRYLKELDISKCQQLQVVNSGAFNGLANLERLDMSFSSQLNSIQDGAFDGLDSLKYLFLQGNNLTTLSEKLILPLSTGGHLRLLDIRQNAIECNCQVEPLRRFLSELKNRSLSHSNVRTTMATSDIPAHLRTLIPSLDDQQAAQWSRKPREPTGLPSPSWAARLTANRGTTLDIESADEGDQLRVVTDVHCHQPDNMKGQLLVTLDPESLGCHDFQWLVMAAAIVAAACLTVAALAVCLFKLRRKSGIRSRYFSRSSIGTSSRTTTSDSLSRKKAMGLSGQHGHSPMGSDGDNVYWEPYFICVQPQKVDINTLAHPPRPTFNYDHRDMLLASQTKIHNNTLSHLPQRPTIDYGDPERARRRAPPPLPPLPPLPPIPAHLGPTAASALHSLTMAGRPLPAPTSTLPCSLAPIMTVNNMMTLQPSQRWNIPSTNL